MRWGLVVAVACTLAVMTTAAAQVNVQPAVAVEYDGEGSDVPASNETTFTATVSNPGSLDGNVALEITSPEGWSAVVEPSSFPLTAGASQPVTITVTAPDAAQGAGAGDVTLSATMTDAAGRGVTASDSVRVQRVDPAPPPPPPSGPDPLLVAGLAAAGVAAVAAIVALVIVRRRRHAAWLARETGITIKLTGGPFPLGLKRESTWKVTLENVSDRPRVAIIGVDDRPDGWVVSVSNPRVALEPKSVGTVTVYARPDDHIPFGQTGKAVVFAKPAEAQERDERIVIDLIADEPRVPVGSGGASATLRPGAPRPSLRR